MILVILLSAAVAVGTGAVPKVAPPALERAEQHVKDLAKILGDLKGMLSYLLLFLQQSGGFIVATAE